MIQGFISYAHTDHAAFDATRRQLRALETAFTTPIELWADDDLHAGQHWDDTIKARIGATGLFILLLSPAFLASDFIRNTEIPAIRARAQSGTALVVPVLLSRCGWKPLFGKLQMVPMRNRQLVPIDKWDPPADGFDDARIQIEHAVRAHFGLTARETDWLTPLLDQRQDPAGPMLIRRDDQFDLDPSGGEADITAATDPVVRQLYPPNHDKAAALAALVKRRANILGSEWDDLAPAVTALAEVLDQPLDRLPEQIATLWERSVRVASLLLMDKRLLAAPEADKTPLEADMHRALDDMVGSLAPWVRSFPSARLLDDQRGEFLRTRALFEPARWVIAQAVADGVVTPVVGATIQGNIATAERGDAQAEKAGHYAIRGVRNALVSAAGYAAGFLAGAAASGYANHSPLIDKVGTWLTGAETGITALVQDFPADLRLALERLPAVLHARLGGKPDEAPPTPDPAISPPAAIDPGNDRDPTFWPDGAVPRWAEAWGSDRYGRWVTFGVDAPDGARVIQRMRWIPPGRFMMGSPESEVRRWSDREGPQHEVTIATGFWLFDTPCTQVLWQAVMGDNPSRFQSPPRPVESVSFEQAEAFIRRLNTRLPGLDLELPSEAQWEYACRAGTRTATYAGDLDILGDNNAPVLDAIAWYGGNSGQGFELADGLDSSGWKDKQYPHARAGTRPVALKAPNAWGLYDMLGNVWEWCADMWHRDYRGAPADGAAWVTPARGGAAYRVLRGGSWFNVAAFARAAYRFGNVPSFRDDLIGFRCVRVQVPSGATSGAKGGEEQAKRAERDGGDDRPVAQRRGAGLDFFAFLRRSRKE